MTYTKDLERIEKVSAKGEASWETWSELVLSLLTHITESLGDLEKLDIGNTNANLSKEIAELKSTVNILKTELFKELDDLKESATKEDEQIDTKLEQLRDNFENQYTLKLSTFLKWFLPIIGSSVLFIVYQTIIKYKQFIINLFN